MDSLNISTSRALKRSRQDDDSGFEYELRPGDTTNDRGFYVSRDQRRTRQTQENVSVRPRIVCPADLEDRFASWMPVPEGDEGLGDSFQSEGEEDIDEDGKRRRYYSSDEPSRLWRPLQQTFLDENLRFAGLGDDAENPTCAHCAKSLDVAGARLFCCVECGVFLQWKSCVCDWHALFPLHTVKEWNGTYWTNISLASLGSVYQLGHGGHPCLHPAKAVRTMVVMGTEHIHSIRFRYCACDRSDRANNIEQLMRNAWYPATTVDPRTCATYAALDLYCLLNVVANINVHDFVGTLERNTDPLGVNKVPDRYKVFGHVVRQYAFLLRVKCAGRGHDAEGLVHHLNGACAVLCWACPHDNINLPEGWREVSAEFRFLYMLILAMDANFHLKNRIRKNEHYDPPTGSGWGHLVEEELYKTHLKDYVAEKDVSTCIAFAALLQKDTRMTTGLRCSGIGGVVCARHECVRPQGVGDLQKGERYSNMDYISSQRSQWKIHLWERMEKMPSRLQLEKDHVTLEFGLPVWHAVAHEKKCQVQNSLSYVKGVGRTDGEGIERTWAGFNPLAWATVEMGLGARHDALEDKISHHNFEKNVGEGDTLPWKLILAISERDRQVTEFEEVDRTLTDELRNKWQAQVDAWMLDRTAPNPYELSAESRKVVPTEASIRLELTKEDSKLATASGGRVHGSSMSAFLTVGMQLEDSQYRIRLEAKGRVLLTLGRKEKVEELRMAFLRKSRKFRNLQQVHMPGVIAEIEAEDDKRDPDLPPPLAEDVKLWLPSQLHGAARVAGCAVGLPEREAKLREAQCGDALGLLHQRLHVKHHLLNHRDDGNAVGQRAATRSYTLIGTLGECITTVAEKYRRARRALIWLRGAEACEHIKGLMAKDITLDEDQEKDAAVRQKLSLLGSGYRKKKGRATLSSKKKVFSWIWTEGGGPGPGEDEGALHDSVRVEWSKALARKMRWEEEWLALWWEARRTARVEGVSPELRGGLEAYAAHQAALARHIARRFKAEWDKSVATRLEVAIREDRELIEAMMGSDGVPASDAAGNSGSGTDGGMGEGGAGPTAARPAGAGGEDTAGATMQQGFTLHLGVASQLILAEELVVFTPVAAHGSADALPQYSVIECQELYAPQVPRLILAPSDLFDLPPLTVPNPCYTGERYMLTPIVTELQFNLQLDEEEGGEEEGRETEGPTADLINTTDNDVVDRAIKHLIRNYVGKQQPPLTTATNSLKLRKRRPS
ncbi:hypothetical protein C8J57DRAFT_1502496 [Mycena rebaudengoi]|nr:hypothetical protein C8J57DRAFT_1502496 [Mycena rebaudengoi]